MTHWAGSWPQCYIYTVQYTYESCCTQAGIFYWQIIDWYAFNITVILLGLLECVAFAHVYGVRRVCDNIREMCGRAPGLYWKSCWLVLTPLVLLVHTD